MRVAAGQLADAPQPVDDRVGVHVERLGGARETLAESPEFQALEERQETVRTPIVEVVRTHPRSVLVAMGARFAENVSYYIFTVFVLTYVTEELGLERAWALNAVLIASAVHLVAIPAAGALSDRVGRRPLYVFGAVGVGVWGFVFFALLDSRSFVAITLAVTVGLVLHAAMYGPQAAFFSEMFGTRVRSRAYRSATSSPRCSPAAWRRSWRSRCWPSTARRFPSPSTWRGRP